MRKKDAFIGHRLKKHRKLAGLSHKEVSFLLGLKYTSTISRWEKGISRPSNVNLLSLAIIYGILMDQFYLDLRQELKEELLPKKDALLKERPP